MLRKLGDILVTQNLGLAVHHHHLWLQENLLDEDSHFVFGYNPVLVRVEIREKLLKSVLSDFDLSHAAQNKLDELAGLSLVKVATVVFIVLAPYPMQDVVNDIILRIRSLLLPRLLLMHLATSVEV